MKEEEESLYLQEVTDLKMSQETCPPEFKEVKLSLNALLSANGVTTMRMIGEVGNQQLNILLDTGSTLSFLQEDTARKLGCNI